MQDNSAYGEMRSYQTPTPITRVGESGGIAPVTNWSGFQGAPVNTGGQGITIDNPNTPVVSTTPAPVSTPSVNPPVVAKTVQNSFQNADGTITVIYSDGSHAIVGGATPATPKDTTSAITDIYNVLKNVGLVDLANQVWDKGKAGIPSSEIMDWVRTSDVYKQRFPGMAALAAKGQRIDERTYIEKETADKELLKQYGIPTGIFDTPEYLGKLIAGNVTTTDLQKRLIAAQNSVLSFDKNVTQYAKDQYGLNTGSLMAWALDPNLALPVIEQQSKAMQIGGAAVQTGFNLGAGTSGELSKAQAEALAAQGITAQQAQQTFANLAQMGQLAQNLPGDISGALTNQELINAGFGTNAQDVNKLGKIIQTRKAEYGAGGQYGGTQAGITGLGAAPLV